MIPLFKPHISQLSKDNVARILDSSWLGLGPETEKFELEFAQYLGAKYAIATNSCTEALRLAVHIASRKSKQAYVISTPNTFIASNLVLVQNDLIPVFTDIDYNTGFMKLKDLEQALSAYHCDLVMFVHYAGYPGDLYELEEIEDKYQVEIIHDCAHACGTEWWGKKLGSDLKYACFSFHAVKPLAIGEGGMLVTNDEEVATKAKQLRWFGIDKSTYQRSQKGYSWDYDIQDYGYKGHMWDIQAAIGRGQLPYLDAGIKKRDALVSRYRKNLMSCEFPAPLLPTNLVSRSAHHLFVVRFRNSRQRQLAMDALTAADIQYGFHYKANYRYKNYESFPIISTKDMEKFEETALTLPLYTELREEEVDKICDVVMEAI